MVFVCFVVLMFLFFFCCVFRRVANVLILFVFQHFCGLFGKFYSSVWV